MKKRICTAFAALFLLTVLVPCFSALASSVFRSYSFTMEQRFVDGWKNGNSFSLPACDAIIYGSVSAEIRYPGTMQHTPEPLPVNYSLYRKGFLNIVPIEVATVYGSATGSFEGSFGSVPESSTYYLCIWKVNQDGWRSTGNGWVKGTYNP